MRQPFSDTPTQRLTANQPHSLCSRDVPFVNIKRQIFLSYTRDDEEKIIALYAQLSEAGFSPWMDHKNILPGADWAHSIRQAIQQCDFFFICLSNKSANRRGEVQKEVQLAFEKQKGMLPGDIYLIPIKLEECEIPEQFSKLQVVSLFEKGAWDRLINALEEGISRRFNNGHHGHSSQPFSETPQGQDLSAAFNPFRSSGRITEPADFFGREELLRQLFEELAKGQNRSLIGEAQIGKSSILSMICALGPQHIKLPRESFIYFNLAPLYDEQDFFDQLCELLKIAPCKGYKLVRALENKRYIVCLDEIEKMSKARFTSETRELLRGLADGDGSPLKLVIASRTPLDQLFLNSPETTSPLANICPQLTISPFSSKQSREFIENRLQKSPVKFSQMEIEKLIAQSGGHPAKLQRAAADLFDHYRFGRR